MRKMAKVQLTYAMAEAVLASGLDIVDNGDISGRA